MEGTVAGVPYVVLPPETDRPDAPTVVAWHLNDPPRTERAMAAALPLAGLDAWRVYLGLPLSGARTPAGGPVRSGAATNAASSPRGTNTCRPVTASRCGSTRLTKV